MVDLREFYSKTPIQHPVKHNHHMPHFQAHMAKVQPQKDQGSLRYLSIGVSLGPSQQTFNFAASPLNTLLVRCVTTCTTAYNRIQHFFIS